jgi:ribose transport system permease protein
MRRLAIWKAVPAEFLAIWPATLLLFIVSPIVAPGSISGGSLLTVLAFASVLAIASIGQTLVIQQGGLDLAVPGVISLAAVFVTKYPDGSNAQLILWVVVALLAGAVAGAVSGIAVTRFRITPLVSTLAVNALLYGCVLFTSKASSVRAVPTDLGNFAIGRIHGIPYLAIVALIAVVLFEVGLRKSRIGRRFIAIGTNSRAARAAGMRVARYQIATYAVAGTIYAAAGVLLAGYLGVPSLFVGGSYLLPTIAAVVLGGTSLFGGSGSVAATAVGALFLTQLQQVTLGMGAAASVQDLIEAAIIALGMALRLVPWLQIIRSARAGRPR